MDDSELHSLKTDSYEQWNAVDLQQHTNNLDDCASTKKGLSSLITNIAWVWLIQKNSIRIN